MREFETAGEYQLVTDLVEQNLITDFRDDLFGLLHSRNIQPDDEFFARGHCLIPAMFPLPSSRMWATRLQVKIRRWKSGKDCRRRAAGPYCG
ncbi:hypothetical protein D3C86_1952030 [compost metagenome]